MEQFGKFKLMKRLGAGGMGEVYLARPDPHTLSIDGAQPDLVVVKRILPHLTTNPRFLRLFLDETRIAARLVHKNIARIYELGEVKGTWYVAMEYVPGRDLRDLLRRARVAESFISPEVVLRIGVDVCQALEYAHKATDGTGKALRIVHRDVSPHNVLISRFGDVKLCDFGVAKAANKAMHTASGILKGKFPYMAPEQASAKKVDARTDVFALGIVLWEALTNRHLFRGKSDAVTVKLVRACEVAAPSSIRADLPKAFDDVVLRALQREPRKRYRDARTFREALQEALAGRPPPDLQRFFHALDSAEDGPVGDGSEPDTEPIGAATPTHGGVAEQSTSTVQVRKSPLLVKPPVLREVKSRAFSRAQELLATASEKTNNLAPQASSFVGRVAELADLHQLFRTGVRLITLLGPGGTGKTRLASQFAQQLVSHFTSRDPEGPQGGVWFCDLTEATTFDEVCHVVARSLEVPLGHGDVTAQLGHALAARGEMLVVLDNFEQVVEHAERTLGRWMELAPETRYVVASREALKIPHEALFEVPPMRVPAQGDGARAVEAVELFIERAKVVKPGWEPSAADEAAIADICRQLDGLPLAIELASAQLATMTPAQLVQKLPDRFDLLQSKSPGVSARQATLRGAIDWSWRMLSKAEASALAQLSIFRGGFSAEAAEAVVDLSELPNPPDVLSTILGLRARSLVRAYYPPTSRGELRYGLFDSIREYAHEKLAGKKLEKAALERHGKFFVALGARLSAGAESNGALLDALELERENLTAVFQRALASGKTGPQALAAVLALDPLLVVRGPFNQHLAMLDQALTALGDGDPGRKALGLEARARSRSARGRLHEAARDAEAMLELTQKTRNRELEGRALSHLGTIERLRGNPSRAWQLLESALARHLEVGDRRMEGRTRSSLGQLQEQSDEGEAALETYEQALLIHREVADRRYEGVTLLNLGGLLQAQGQHEEARTLVEEALAIQRELGNRRSEGIARLTLGDLCRDLGHHAAAVLHYQQALAIAREVGSRRIEGIIVAALGSLAQEQGNLEDAVARLREALKVLAEVGDKRHEGLARAQLAAAEGGLGQLDSADQGIEAAAQLLRDAGDNSFLDALEVYRAHIELAHLLHGSDPRTTDALESSVKARVRRAERPKPRDTTHPDGVPSPAARSEYVRAALRALRAAMRRAGRPLATA
ncbi:MAG: protein kinase [Myxococcaceae bacterium]|nr:protein kinase [Myxococcaceae bacterium]